ncbi:MAG: Rid family detoxifying hydrolase [Planctomycetota bacterium]|nr:Rid family detoxifying hydrolase [Planctomycetota bacterium]
MEFVITDQAPTPGGHYSQAVVHQGLVYVSGQLPIDPETGQSVTEGDIEQQGLMALTNVTSILEAAGSRLDLTLKVSVYISDISLWGRFNKVYAEFFGAHRPARVVIPTRDLHHGVLIEIDAIAALPESSA